jgi:hypothetical protein
MANGTTPSNQTKNQIDAIITRQVLSTRREVFFQRPLPRAFFSRMILALAVLLKGFGLALRSASQVSMAASSSATLC